MLNCEIVKVHEEVTVACMIGMEDKCVTLLSFVPSSGTWKGWDGAVAFGDICEEYPLGWIECFIESSVLKDKTTHTVTPKLYASMKRSREVTVFSDGSILFPRLQ